ncbi:MAG TPA: hypothetical protein VJ600_04625 [Holophagaceae bacterium]|nr:hypothetical protein [Holophagaceae bacterium]
MTPLPTPPDFPQAPASSVKPGRVILPVLAIAALFGGGMALRASHRAPAVEYTPAPPSYEEALREAEAKDAARKQADQDDHKTAEAKPAGKALWG